MDLMSYRKSRMFWFVNYGVIDIERIPQVDMQEKLFRVVELIQNDRVDEAIDILPDIYFEYDPNNNPELTSFLFSNSTYRILIDPGREGQFLTLDCYDDYLIINFKVVFDVEVTDDLPDSMINESLEWLEPWYSGKLSIPFLEVNDDNEDFVENELGLITGKYAVGDLHCCLLEDSDLISDFI